MGFFGSPRRKKNTKANRVRRLATQVKKLERKAKLESELKRLTARRDQLRNKL